MDLTKRKNLKKEVRRDQVGYLGEKLGERRLIPSPELLTWMKSHEI